MIKINRFCYYSNSSCPKKKPTKKPTNNSALNKSFTWQEYVNGVRICMIIFLLLFVRLFKVFSSHSRMFHSYGDVTIAGEVLKIMTYARHLWPLSSEGSLACHTYCDTEHPFIMVISEDAWHSHLLPSVWQWSCQYLF